MGDKLFKPWFLVLQLYLCTLFSCILPSNPNEPKPLPSKDLLTIGIIVNKNLYPLVADKIDKLTKKIARVESKKIWLNVSFDANTPIEQLKDSLRYHYNKDNLDGAVLIGDLPVARYEVRNLELEDFICDLFFMDLDGNWIDTIGKTGVFEDHNGNINAEIWISRLVPSTVEDDANAMLSDYFNRCERWMNGEYSKNTKGLFVMDPGLQMNGAFEFLYNKDTYDSYISNDVHPFIKEQWLKALNEPYGYSLLVAHGSSNGHMFKDSFFTITDLENAAATKSDNGILFLNLYSCNNAEFTKKNIAHYYVLKHNTLVAIGAANSGGMDDCRQFHYALRQGLSFGNAFKYWFNNTVLYPVSKNPNIQYFGYGMTIVGLGFLNFVPYKNISPVYVTIKVDSGGTTSRKGYIPVVIGDSLKFDVFPEQNFELDTILGENVMVEPDTFFASPLNIFNGRTLPVKCRVKIPDITKNSEFHVKFKLRKEFNVTLAVSGCAKTTSITPVLFEHFNDTFFQKTFYEKDLLIFTAGSDLFNCCLNTITSNGIAHYVPGIVTRFDTSFTVTQNTALSLTFAARNIYAINIKKNGTGIIALHDKYDALPQGLTCNTLSPYKLETTGGKYQIKVPEGGDILIRLISQSENLQPIVTIDTNPVSDLYVNSNRDYYLCISGITANHEIGIEFGE